MIWYPSIVPGGHRSNMREVASVSDSFCHLYRVLQVQVAFLLPRVFKEHDWMIEQGKASKLCLAITFSPQFTKTSSHGFVVVKCFSPPRHGMMIPHELPISQAG